MTTLLISEFKAKCIEVLNSVHDTGQPIIVTRRGKPLAKIAPIADASPGTRQLGALAGEAVERGDIVHHASADDWESLR